MNIDSILSQDTPAATAIDYDTVFEQFYKAIYRFAFSLTGNASDAADLIQGTYRALRTKGDSIRDARKVKIWLFATLYRQFLGRRHATRFPETPIESGEGELPSVTPGRAGSLDACLVVSTLHGLGDKYRAALTMFYLEEFSYKEMAEVLGLPIGTIKSRLSRGTEILRCRLQKPSPTAVNPRHASWATARQSGMQARAE